MLHGPSTCIQKANRKVRKGPIEICSIRIPWRDFVEDEKIPSLQAYLVHSYYTFCSQCVECSTCVCELETLIMTRGISRRHVILLFEFCISHYRLGLKRSFRSAYYYYVSCLLQEKNSTFVLSFQESIVQINFVGHMLLH